MLPLSEFSRKFASSDPASKIISRPAMNVSRHRGTSSPSHTAHGPASRSGASTVSRLGDTTQLRRSRKDAAPDHPLLTVHRCATRRDAPVAEKSLARFVALMNIENPCCRFASRLEARTKSPPQQRDPLGFKPQSPPRSYGNWSSEPRRFVREAHPQSPTPTVWRLPRMLRGCRPPHLQRFPTN